MSDLTAIEKAVWESWNALEDAHPSPVKTIAAELEDGQVDHGMASRSETTTRYNPVNLLSGG